MGAGEISGGEIGFAGVLEKEWGGEGDDRQARGLSGGDARAGSSWQTGESGRAGLGSSERERGADRAEWREAGRGAGWAGRASWAR